MHDILFTETLYICQQNISVNSILFVGVAKYRILLDQFTVENLGAKIKRLREERKLTQSGLSIKAGLSAGYISKIETNQPGYTNPTNETLIAIAQALEVDVGELRGSIVPEDENNKRHKDKNLSNVTPYKLIEIPLLSGTVSASSFSSSFDDWGGERILMPVDRSENKVAWRISGNSMAPEYNDGDIAVIAHGVRFSDGDDVIAENHKGVTIKRLKYLKNGSVELRPLNPEYQTMTFNKGDDLEILGVVIGLYRRMKK